MFGRKGKSKTQQHKKTKESNQRNKEKVIPIGRTLLTKDEHLPVEKGKERKLKDTRPVAVIDKNKNEELAIVPLTTKKTKNTTLINGYKNRNGKKSHFRHFVETKDNEGNPITANNKKFKQRKDEYDLNEEQVEKIREKVLNHVPQAQRNREKLEELHKE